MARAFHFRFRRAWEMVRGLHPIVPDFPFVLPEAMVKEFRLSLVAVILSARSSLEIGCCSSALSRFATVGLEIAAVGSFAFADSAVVDFAVADLAVADLAVADFAATAD